MRVFGLCTGDGLGIGRALIGACVFVGLVACGDDDTPSKPDASTDGAVEAGPSFIPKRDASVAPTDPIRECDRFDPASSCPVGQTCDVLVRYFAGEGQPSIYSGCVKTVRERGLGDPCEPDFTTTTPYQTEGLTDLVFRDQCGPNLICTADPKIRGGTSCQPSCSSGPAGDAQMLCNDPKDFCVGGMSRPFREYCRPSDSCDVLAQSGCPKGLNCYLRLRDDGAGFLSVCFPPAPMPLADGATCNDYNICRLGSSCNGPLSKAPSQWAQADFVCRAACAADGSTAGGGDGDAGSDDGGTASGGCGSGRKCSSIGASGLNVSTISTPPYGQCE
jgi:hypothetical protein